MNRMKYYKDLVGICEGQFEQYNTQISFIEDQIAALREKIGEIEEEKKLLRGEYRMLMKLITAEEEHVKMENEQVDIAKLASEMGAAMEVPAQVIEATQAEPTPTETVDSASEPVMDEVVIGEGGFSLTEMGSGNDSGLQFEVLGDAPNIEHEPVSTPPTPPVAKKTAAKKAATKL